MNKKDASIITEDLSNEYWWGLWDEDFCEWSCDCQIEPVDVIYHLLLLLE